MSDAFSQRAELRSTTLGLGERVAAVPFGLLVFAAALVLRVAVVLATSDLGIGLDDMFQYDMLARSLASGNGFRWYAPADARLLAPFLNLDLHALQLDPRGMPTTFRAPLYPAVVALFYMLFGAGEGRFLAVRLAQAFLGAALAPMTYIAARRALTHATQPVVRTERAARLASVLVAGYPILIVYPLALATENLFFPLILGALIAVQAIAGAQRGEDGAPKTQAREMWLALAAGGLLGLSALTRSVVVPVLFAALVWLWFVLQRRRLAVLTGLAFAVTVAPWMVRNSVVAGGPTGIETSMGYNLYVGYHPESTGSFQFGPSLDLLTILDDGRRDQIGTQMALQFVKDDPGRFPYLMLRRLGHFFNFEWRPFLYFYSNGVLGPLPPALIAAVLMLLSVPFVLVCVAALFGAALAPRTPQLTLIALVLMAYLLPHIFILSGSRFHLAVLPLMAILAGHALAGVDTRPAGGAPGRAWVLLGLALLTLNWASHLARTWPVIAQLLGPNGSRLHLPY